MIRTHFFLTKQNVIELKQNLLERPKTTQKGLKQTLNGGELLLLLN